MIVLFTDFGSTDLYAGQVKAALLAEAPAVTVIDLLHDAPAFDVEAGAHLLAALAARFPPDAVFLAVVDPGVGGPRAPVVVEAGGQCFVGPDNGLLSVVAGRAEAAKVARITWKPAHLSASFHGRDLFAPVAGRIAAGKGSGLTEACGSLEVALDPGDLPRLIYIDHYGNAVTGLRARAVGRTARLRCRALDAGSARVFCEAGPGVPFWYENSIGLVEFAISGGSAASAGGLRVGDPVTIK